MGECWNWSNLILMCKQNKLIASEPLWPEATELITELDIVAFWATSSAQTLRGLTARDVSKTWGLKRKVMLYLRHTTPCSNSHPPPPPPPKCLFVLSLCNKLIWFIDLCSRIFVSEQPYVLCLLIIFFQGSSLETISLTGCYRIFFF